MAAGQGDIQELLIVSDLRLRRVPLGGLAHGIPSLRGVPVRTRVVELTVQVGRLELAEELGQRLGRGLLALVSQTSALAASYHGPSVCFSWNCVYQRLAFCRSPDCR